MHATVAQNKAHRADLLWVKVSKSKYRRSDGVFIQKWPNRENWVVYLPNGDKAAMPNFWEPSGYEPHTIASAHNAKWAKSCADGVTATSPAYQSYSPREGKSH